MKPVAKPGDWVMFDGYDHPIIVVQVACGVAYLGYYEGMPAGDCAIRAMVEDLEVVDVEEAESAR